MLYAEIRNKNYGVDDASWVATTHDTTHDATHVENGILDFCATPRSRQEIMDHLGLVNRRHFVKRYLEPMVESGKLRMTIPDKPKSKNQKYVAFKKNDES